MIMDVNINWCAFADEACDSIDGQIAALKRNDLEYLEVRGVNGKNISEFSVAEAKELKKKLDDNGIKVWSIGSPIGKISIDDDFDKHVEVFKNLCDVTLALGADRMRIFSFYVNWATAEEPVIRDKVFTKMRRLCEVAPEEIVLCHENERGIYGESDINCKKIHDEFARIRACYDMANFALSGVKSRMAWELLKEYVEYVHIKDVDAQGNIVPAGTGICHVRDILEAYIYRGGKFITAEPHLQHFTGLDKLSEVDAVKVKNGTLSREDAFDIGVAAMKSQTPDRLIC